MFVFIVSVLLYLYLSFSLFACLYITILSVLPEWRINFIILNPHFGGREGRRGSAMAPLERAIVLSYRLSIMTVALYVTIRPQFAIECL